MNLTLGSGKGKAAFVTVTKTDADYRRRVGDFDKLEKKYQALKKLVYPDGVNDNSTAQPSLQQSVQQIIPSKMLAIKYIVFLKNVLIEVSLFLQW